MAVSVRIWYDMKKSLLFTLIAGTLIAALLVFSFLQLEKMGRIDEQTASQQEYARHFLMVSGDDSQLYRSMYEAAKKTAAQEDALLEWVYAGEQGENTVRDLIKIGIASRVDGILLGSPGKNTDLINEAAEHEIPTVMLLEDDSESSRVSFVGINGYQLGEIYGEQARQLMKDGENQIMVLVSSNTENVNQNIILSRIKEIVGRNLETTRQVVVQPYGIDTSDSFEVEERIRDIFVNAEELPDILICLDAVSTECAYQSIVDYNQVGNVQVIGFYASDTILDAIAKKLIPVAVDVDAKDIGRLGVSALTEYLDQGYVSNYFSVGLDIITEQTMNRSAE